MRSALAGVCVLLHAALLFTGMPLLAGAADYRELSLEQAIQQLRRGGLNILYSSDLVRPSMRVREEPRASDSREILDELLSPYGLRIRNGPNGVLIVVRSTRSAPQREVAGDRVAAITMFVPDLEEVIVSASHYEFVRALQLAGVSFSAADLQASPDLGDDPLRAAARVPGVASSDYSARVNIRGGDADETLVRFDDLRLQNPFHLKDFQSTFSTIGPGVVDAMRIYSGGFPVAFGDRMSGVIDIDPLAPRERSHNELALSTLNASVLMARRTDDERGEWLLSARRGNLDLIVEALNPAIGRPSYLDFYGRAGRWLTDSLRVSASALVSDDAIVLFDSDREEEARAEYRDAYYWLRLDYQPSLALSGSLLVARSDLDSERAGRADQEGIASGELTDRREFAIDSLQSDWSVRLRDELLLQFGGEWRGMRGRYDYRDQATFDLLFDAPGAALDTERSHELRVLAEGDHYAAYTNLRFEPSRVWTVDAGIRWDRETLSPDASDQFSPRLSVLRTLGERAQLRASWGRYFQTQSITELQVSDGVSEFYPPQRSHHLILSLEHALANELDLRIEAYRKEYRSSRPRFENLLNTFVLLPELKPDRIRIAPDRAMARGVELSLRRNAGRTWNWWVSYTWSSVEDEFEGMETPRSWDQTHLLNGGLAWCNERWEFSMAGTWRSGWPTSGLTLVEADPIPIVATPARNRDRLDDYVSLDARVARSFALGEDSLLTVFLEVNNVFNRANQCCVEYEIEDEEAGFGFDVSRRSYLPITPSVGAVWRF